MQKKKNKKTTQKAVRSRRTTKYPIFRPVADQHFFSLEEEQHFFWEFNGNHEERNCFLPERTPIVKNQFFKLTKTNIRYTRL